MKFSLANKLNKQDIMNQQAYLSLLTMIVIFITLMFFRRSQRLIDREIDVQNQTPGKIQYKPEQISLADFTILVKNIPIGLDVNYKQELNNIFTYYAIPESDLKIVVTKIVLVYDIEDIVVKEEEIKELIKEKQQVLTKNKQVYYTFHLRTSLNFNDEEVKSIDKKIEELEEEIEKMKDRYESTCQNFIGVAFVSFLNDEMKKQVLRLNQHTFAERISSYFNKGKLKNPSFNDLSWMDQKLFLEQAPEPNDVDWEFIHIKTDEKIKARIKSWIISILFMGICFAIIYLLSQYCDSLNDMMEDEIEKGTLNPTTSIEINFLSSSISWIIVLFNKFVIGKTFHVIVDLEKISSKTKFNIQFAFKLTVALFLNTAMISFVIDIVLLKHIISQGGFIQNETQVFFLNALFPPIVWLIDPYQMLQLFQRNLQLKKKEKSVVTQEEANQLMEHTEYYQAKRYADIMKTMWFTFLFGSAIPMGILCSMVGLTCYYWADKYNVMRRRTIKENLAKEVSIEMIEMLEMIIILNGLGNMTMSYSFYGIIYWQDVIVFFFGLIYSIIPMQVINDKIFPLEEFNESMNYDEAQKFFITDYDIENPVTKKLAQSLLEKQLVSVNF